MLFGGWEADYPDLNGNIEIMYAANQVEGGYNAAAYVNPAVERLIDAQRSTTDPARRFELQAQAMNTIVDEAPYIVFDYSLRQSALNKKYTGLAVSPAWLWVLPIQNVRRAN
jgi:peptide/nickel transport system substrate-binding protein